MNRQISAMRLQRAWEDGAAEPILRRALILLQLDAPDAGPEELQSLTIGERDRRLLALREGLVGERFEALTVCPSCGEKMELSFTTRQLLKLEAAAGSEPLHVQKNGYSIHVRLPNTTDLLVVLEGSGTVPAVESLLERCILSAEKDVLPCPP